MYNIYICTYVYSIYNMYILCYKYEKGIGSSTYIKKYKILRKIKPDIRHRKETRMGNK